MRDRRRARRRRRRRSCSTSRRRSSTRRAPTTCSPRSPGSTHDLGTTVVLAEHRLERAAPLADRAVLVDGGARRHARRARRRCSRRYPGAPSVTRLGRAARLGPAAAHRARRPRAARSRAPLDLAAARRRRRRARTPGEPLVRGARACGSSSAAAPCCATCRPRPARGRRRRAARPQRLGQDHAAARARRAARRRRAARVDAHERRRVRAAEPEHHAVRADRAARARGDAAAARPHRRRRGRPLARRARHSARSPTATRAASRAASANGSRSPRSRSAARRCCCSTSRPAAWTRRRAPRSSTRCARTSTAAARSCSPPTTSSSRRACATHAVVLGDGEVVADGDARARARRLAVRAAGAAGAAAVPHRRGSRRGAGPPMTASSPLARAPAPPRACGRSSCTRSMVVRRRGRVPLPVLAPGDRARRARRTAATRRSSPRSSARWSWSAVTLEVRRGTMNGATVAILGMLAAVAGPAAAHRPARRRQRHLLPHRARRRRVRPAVRAAARAVRDGGVGGHHRRHRAVAAVPDARARLDGRGRRLRSASSPRRLRPVGSRWSRSPRTAGCWGFLYGAIMNLWFWPFARGGALDWAPGLGLGATLAPLLVVLRRDVARRGTPPPRSPTPLLDPRDRPRAHAHPPPLRPPPRPRRRLRRRPTLPHRRTGVSERRR